MDMRLNDECLDEKRQQAEQNEKYPERRRPRDNKGVRASAPGGSSIVEMAAHWEHRSYASGLTWYFPAVPYALYPRLTAGSRQQRRMKSDPRSTSPAPLRTAGRYP